MCSGTSFPSATSRLSSHSCGKHRIRTQYSIGVPVPPIRGLCSPRDRKHIEIEIGRESPVESQLLVAKMASPFERREVDETQIDGLLHFVSEFSGQKDPGNVRLERLNPHDAAGIGGRLRRE